MARKKSDDDDRAFDDAVSKLNSEYAYHIGMLAESIVEEISAGDITDSETMQDALHSTVDGSAWVIYTFRAKLIMTFSKNSDHGIEEMGADNFDWKSGVPWSQLAYFALAADLAEELARRGVDFNDPTGAPLPDDDEED